ncbi:hypothetical protein AVEN_220094-1 [Araneus ventricosus]|uniref:Uncharacterized protein n=1 Tax=Araneus ventricosus TaxID=182803 RepID=A0A4Y2J5F0_ARAVE|nr:hypothetical protein AVEN_220094-1 [Araneus ventricosus]
MSSKGNAYEPLSINGVNTGIQATLGEQFLVYSLKSFWSRESILFTTGHGPFPSYLYRFRLHHSDIFTCGEKGDPLHYVTSCHMTLSHHFTKPSAENTQLCWKSLLSNKLSRIKISELISFLTENANLIKQPPDATSSSYSDPDFSPSPRPQTYGLRPSRGSISRTLISPPTSI